MFEKKFMILIFILGSRVFLILFYCIYLAETNLGQHGVAAMDAKITFVLILLSLFSSHEANYDATKNKTKVIIDHDGGADDAMAIFMFLLYEKYFDGPQIVGLTTVNGNVNESQVFANSQRILYIADRQEVPIYRGSIKSLVIGAESDYYFGHDGLGDNNTVEYKPIEAAKEQAVFALIELSKKYEGELIVVAIGAQTNIALAIRLDPGFIGRLKQLYVGAGNIYDEKHSNPEFNALMDVESYHIVVEAATTDKVTVLPFTQVYASLELTKDWRLNILGNISTDIMKAQNSFERLSLPQSDNWTQLDPAVAAIVINDAIIETIKYANNSIIMCGSERGINTNDFNSVNPNIRVIYSGHKDVYKNLLLSIFTADVK